MQCCAQALLARSRSFLLPGSVLEHVSAFLTADIRRSNAGEATSTPSSPFEGSGSAPQAPVAANSVTQAGSATDTTAEQNSDASSAMPAPPAQWHKRGAWIDPSHIEKRMFPDELEKPAVSKKEPATEVAKSVAALIRYRGGPISVAEYMREVLYHPLGGFYAARGDRAIGSSGHFITSPEISVLFGEVMAAWVLQHYQEVLGAPSKVAYIELGPGNGTLAKQILSALTMMPGGNALLAAMRIHMVEVSPGLRAMQAEALNCKETTAVLEPAAAADTTSSSSEPQSSVHTTPSNTPKTRLLRPSALSMKRSGKDPSGPATNHYLDLEPLESPPEPQAQQEASNFSEEVMKLATDTLQSTPPLGGGSEEQQPPRLAQEAEAEGEEQTHGETVVPDAIVWGRCDMTGGEIFWHSKLDEVPKDMPCIVMGHEFLDALPVHVFRHDEQRGWLEVLVDEEPNTDDHRRLRFVLSPGPTKAVQHIMGRRHRVLRGDSQPPSPDTLSTPPSSNMPPIAPVATPSNAQNLAPLILAPTTPLSTPPPAPTQQLIDPTPTTPPPPQAIPPSQAPSATLAAPSRHKPIHQLSKATLQERVESATAQILRHNQQQQQQQHQLEQEQHLKPELEVKYSSQGITRAGDVPAHHAPLLLDPSDSTTPQPPSATSTDAAPPPPPPSRQLKWQGGPLPGMHALEVGAEAMAVVEAVALRIEACGGFALFVDYGKDGPYDSSLNAIRNHDGVHPLHEPGCADLTAWVDFSALRQAVDESLTRVSAHGPLSQGHFCLANGMEQRVDALLQKTGRTQEEVDALEDGFARLVAGTEHHPQGMGHTYKVMVLAPSAGKAPFPFGLDFSQYQEA